MPLARTLELFGYFQRHTVLASAVVAGFEPPEHSTDVLKKKKVE
ncbi:hypothetical protein ACFQ07_28870 [Actinomadura adrarensis]|uniref:Uncharacterized protein n=1 Tax=Actinomadura adrarensis TaxID=1819600 RepID=A0ABW3CQT3_9ACTN